MYAVILLGVATGCRTLTPMAVLCWYMWLAKLPISGQNYWEANVVAVIVFSLMAVGEYVADTLPQAPSRKSLPLLLSRLVVGMWVGVSVFSSFTEPLAGGAIFGGVGVLIGTYGGYSLRMRFARRVGRDFPVAVTESALTLLLSLVAMQWAVADWIRQSTHAY